MSGAGLDRRKVVDALLERRDGLLVVAGLGSAAWDCTAAGDHPLTFPLWGAMGSACMIGLGLALAQPRRRVLVLDNERYGETGMQKTHTAYGTDLAAVASACGFADSRIIRRNAEIAAVRSGIYQGRGPLFFQVKVRPDALPLVLPPRDGAHLKHRFREALLGEKAAAQ